MTPHTQDQRSRYYIKSNEREQVYGIIVVVSSRSKHVSSTTILVRKQPLFLVLVKTAAGYSKPQPPLLLSYVVVLSK
jgi:hypothetical protein